MENLEKIQKLISVANRITNDIEEHKKAIKNSTCDKSGMGFNLDNRFKSHNGVLVRVDSWRGYYGNSGCSTAIGTLDEEIFSEHFLKVLNKRFDELMMETARSIRNKAIEYSKKAITELNETLQAVQSLELEKGEK